MRRNALRAISNWSTKPLQSIPMGPLNRSPLLSSIPSRFTPRRAAALHTTPTRWRTAYTSDHPQLPPPSASSASSTSASASSADAAGPSRSLEVGGEKQRIGKVEPRLSLTFTCTAPIPSSSSVSTSAGGANVPYSGGTATTSSAAPLPPPPGGGTPAEFGALQAEGQGEGERPCGHRSTHEFSKKSYEHGIVLIQCPSCKSRHLIADHLGWFKESMEDGRYKNVEDLLRAKGERVTRGRVNLEGDVEYDGTS